jgi:hypothetical protein
MHRFLSLIGIKEENKAKFSKNFRIILTFCPKLVKILLIQLEVMEYRQTRKKQAAFY